MRARSYWGLLLLILAAAGLLRFEGLHWDDGTHPHPDERYLTMVASAIHTGTLTPTERDESARQAHLAACAAQFPHTRGVGGWFASSCSDFNPGNVGYAGYAYGQFPLALVRVTAEVTAQLSGQLEYTRYGGIHIVGRAVSAIADLLTLLTVFLLGRLLWCRAVGVLAASFYAVAALPIQSAHFWTVDSVATLFASLSILYGVRLVRFGDRGDALALGAACALAVSSKISLAPLAVLLPLAAYWAPSGVVFAVRPDWLTRASIRLPSVLLGCAGAAITFRIASPYAFSGSSWHDFALAQTFIDQIQESRRLASGIVDIPPNWQWLARPPWLWAGQNLLVWGLGLVLGLTAVVGVGRRGWRLLRATPIERARAIPLIWLVGYFFWMGQQWVASMRYFLPVYPLLCLFAAAWLVPWWRAWRIADSGRTEPPSLRRTWWPAAIAVVVMAGAGTWAFALHTVHTTLHPYVAATNWIVRNVPGPVSAQISTTQQASALLNWPAAGDYDGRITPRVAATAIAPTNGSIDRLRLHDVRVVRADPTATIVVRILDAGGRTLAATHAVDLRLATTDPEARHGSLDLPLLAPLDLIGGHAYRLQIEVAHGAVALAGSRIAYEGAWNDVVPIRAPRLAPADSLDLRGPSGTVAPGSATVDPFAEGYYVPLDLAMATADDELKRGRLIERIDEAEWLIVPNNRFYDSMSRNPLRFPLSTRFYDALFSGELGYARVLVVDALPRFAGITFDDQSLPAPGQGLASGRRGLMWAAEEAFSVYDHPTVFVFRKTPDYSRAAVERLFAPLNLTTVDAALGAEKPVGAGRLAWSTLDANSAPDGLLRKADSGADAATLTRPEAPAAGPWATAAAVIGWYGLSLLLGGLAWPWLASVWPGLPDRGYSVARIAGLAAVATAAWWLAWLGLPAWSASGLATIIAVGIVATFPVARRRVRRERDWLRGNARTLWAIEAAFLALFALGLLLRGLDPDLWAPSFGGEKPMDFALFNSVLATIDFPPADPWFSGGRLNYYYFGWVMVGVATKLTGVAPAIAYNLALPTWWAMTGIGAFSLAWNAYAKTNGGVAHGRRRWLAGAVALVAAVLLGNLDLPRAVAPNLRAVQTLATSAEPADSAAWKIALTRNSERWLWAPSRTVGEREHSSHEINEFPAFTFLYGDLHPHLMAWPLQLFVLTGLLALVLPVTGTGSGQKPGTRALLSQIAVVAVGVGLLHATNIWDWPFYLALAGLGSAFAAWRISHGLRFQAPSRMQFHYRVAFIAFAVITLIAGQAFVALPLSRALVTGDVSVRLFEGTRTPLVAWFAIHGWFLLAIGGWISLLAREPWARPPRAVAALRIARWSGVAYTVVSVALLVFGASGEVAAVGVQLAILAWLVELLWRNLHCRTRVIGLLAAVLAFGLDLLVEFVVLGQDIGRMNTYFKVHLQIWILLSVAAGIAIAELAEHGVLRRGSKLYAAVLGVASLLALAYLPLATYGRSQARFDPSAALTLDGEAFMSYAIYDYQGRSLKLADDLRIINWLRNHAGPDDVILEAQLQEYRWASRISVFTGRQAVLGYRHHESQQRPLAEIEKAVELRRQNIQAMYESTDTEAVLRVLRHYGVRYVVVGGLERAAYRAPGIEKFRRMVDDGELEAVFKSGDDIVYRLAAPAVAQPTLGAHW